MGPGEQIGAYTIESKIGEGGMSEVYRATDPAGTPVVVKRLKVEYLSSQQLIDRFVRGATILKELRHPHLARVYDVFDYHGHHIIVEQYLGGGSLADLLARSGPPSVRDALVWCRDALRALNYVHEFGIVHRDIKPSNLMLDEAGRIHVIDFGIARVFGDKRLTRTGDGAIGTPWYMSPEQIRTPNDVDHLTDVYSAGVVLYELLTGQVPFDGPSQFSIQQKITSEPLPALSVHKPGIDAAVERLVRKAMEKEARFRHGGCGEFAAVIDQILAGTQGGWRDTWRRIAARVAAGARSLRARPVTVGAAVAALVLLIGLLNVDISALITRGESRDPAPTEPGPQPSVQPPVDPPPALPTDNPGIAITARVNDGSSADVRAPARLAYRYTVRNSGNVALTNVRVVDRHSGAPVLRDGDANHNGALDVGEVWEFRAEVAATREAVNSDAFTSRAEVVSDQARAAAAPLPVTIKAPPVAGETVPPPQKLRDATPTYPPAAQAAGVTGNVRLELTIAANGRVQDVRIVDRPAVVPELHALLERAAIEAARQWIYAPTMLNGTAVPVVTRATVQFVLKPAAPSPTPATPPAAPTAVRVGDGIKSPQKIRDVAPIYPPMAQSARMQGVVVVEATIGTDGRVSDARVLRSIPLLDQAALEAVRQWAFTPTLLNGAPVPVIMTVSVSFSLK